MLIPEMTLIPVDYANHKSSNFRILIKNNKAKKTKKSDKGKKGIKTNKPNPVIERKPLIKEPFLLLWLTNSDDSDNYLRLEQNILKSFPNFPIEKSITGKINLLLPSNSKLELSEVTGKILPLSMCVRHLIDIPIIQNFADQNINHLKKPLSYSTYFWSLMLKYCLQIISEGNFYPVISQIQESKSETETESDPYAEKEFESELKTSWHHAIRSKKDLSALNKIIKFAPMSSHNIPILQEKSLQEKSNSKKKSNNITKEIIPIENLINIFLANMTNEIIRNAINTEDPSIFSDIYGFEMKHVNSLGKKLSWDIRLISSIVSKKEAKMRMYNVSEFAIPNIIAHWTRMVNLTQNIRTRNLSLELVPPKNKNKTWNLEYKLQDFNGKQKSSKSIKLNEKSWNSILHLDVDHYRETLQLLYILGLYFPPITKTLREKNPSKCKLNTDEASQFLEGIYEELENNGVSIKIPSIFDKNGDQRLKVVMRIKPTTKEIEDLKSQNKEENQATAKSTTKGSINDIQRFDMESILKYEWELKVGNEYLSSEEFDNIIETGESLIFRNNKWVLFNRREINAIKNTFNEERSGTITGDKALFLGLTGKSYIQPSNLTKSKKGRNFEEKMKNGPYEVVLEGPIKSIVDTLTGKQKIKEYSQPNQLNGNLRAYQLDGMNWIIAMTRMGLNVCLADDMGLGKTIQIIAYILQSKKMKENAEEKTDKNAKKSTKKSIKENNSVLVVCPTSVIGNWRTEITKFAPSLSAGLHYGPKRPDNLIDMMNNVKKYDILLTTYGTLRRDSELLQKINWESLILDESQYIKNYRTQQAKSAFSMNAKSKICLSGTPIENRLSELWSMFHFLNPFLLGSRNSFMKRFMIPIERLGDESATAKLRNTVAPFLLRRLKTDKSIIKDLPEKQEIKQYVTLSEAQKQLYTKIVEESLEQIESVNQLSAQGASKNAAITRSGTILSTIIKLKQICNHPAQALHQPPDFSDPNYIKNSGKLRRLMEIINELIQTRDKMLIFTQFTEMGGILEKIFIEELNIKPLYLHGSIPQKKRDELVSLFQNDVDGTYPIFILSLKAGGTGLNLTQASTVIHFDRWWNPSVENQATDRAYRIGQKKNVMVYKMISSGTIEEKVDKMIEQKKDLADSIISSTGEKWITDLSNSELRELFMLEEGL